MEKQILQQNLKTNENSLNTLPSNPTMMGNSQTHTQDVTRFTTSGEINTVRDTNSKNAEDHFKVVSDTKQRTINNFLARPYTYSTGILPTTKQRFLQIDVMDCIKKMVSRYKLMGFFAFKGRAKVQVVVNTQPFHSGILGLSYTPMYNEPDGDRHEAGFYAKYSNDEDLIRYLTGCPTTYMNLGSTNMMELSVPYVGDNGFCKLDGGEFGTFHLYTLTPPRDSTNAPTIHYTVYFSLEDVETYATYPSVIAQSSDTLATIIKALQAALPGASGIENSPTQEQEAQDNNTGLVSGIANSVGSVAKSLTAIPGIADVAGPVSWVADGVGKVAKMFGFSKPHGEQSPEAVWINPVKNFNHADQNDNSTKMSFNANQEIEIREVGPQKTDEMNMTYVLSKPVWDETIQWSTDHEYGRQLQYVQVTPRNFAVRRGWGDAHNVWHIAPTFVGYFAYLFAFWTGTIRLTYMFASNKFYSGRLRLVYYAQDSSSKEFQHLYSHIIDIRDADTFTVDLPFIHTRPWRKTAIADNPCYLKIFVETPLVASETVSSVMDIAMLVSGGKDLCFAGPQRVRGMPCNGVDFTKLRASKREKVEAQGYTLNPNSNQRPANIPLVDDVTDINPEEAHKLSIGDPVTSLRALSKKYVHNGFINWNSQFMLIRPFKPLSVQDNQHITPTQFQPADFVDWITALYRFRAGGMRVALDGLEENCYIAHRDLQSVRYPDDHYKMTYLGGVDNHLSPGILGQCDINDTLARAEHHHSAYHSMFPHVPANQGHLRFEVPYYSGSALTRNDRVRFNIDVGSDGKTSLDEVNSPVEYGKSYDDSNNIITIYRNNNTERFITAYRAAADDFNCGFLLGPPGIRVELAF